MPPFRRGSSPEYIYEILDKTKGLRLMGQRLIPDSYMFQHLVFPQVDAYTGPIRPAGPSRGLRTGNVASFAAIRAAGRDGLARLQAGLQILIDEGDPDTSISGHV